MKCKVSLHMEIFLQCKQLYLWGNRTLILRNIEVGASMGIATMTSAAAIKKHYSQAQSSVEINERASVPPTGVSIVAMSEAAAMIK